MKHHANPAEHAMPREQPEFPAGYLERFAGIGRLYGMPALDKISRSRVTVVGLGGVGSWCAEALARSGIGHITLIDMDDICVTNTNRQLQALDGDIGRPKVEVLANRIARINPACEIKVVCRFLTASNADMLLADRPDAVVDAIDSIANKCVLVVACLRLGIPVVTSGGAAGKLDPTALRTSDLGKSGGDRLLRQMRKRLRDEHGFPAACKHFGVSCVYSTELELQVPPACEGLPGSANPEGGRIVRRDCEWGMGTSTMVSGSFGFAIAAEVIRGLIAPRGKTHAPARSH